MATDGAEREAAVAAVRAAAELCRGAQGRLVAGETLTKGDASPVTVADFAAQAVVIATLTEQLGAVELVGEEDAAELVADDRSDLRASVTDLVRRSRGGAIDECAVIDWIAAGSSDATGHRYWTLDPIDGTKGFLRGDQYAIALALIERGEVVLGVLGCPNLPNDDGAPGSVFVAGGGECLVVRGDDERFVPVRVAAPASLAAARLCESVESGHSNHDHAAQIARRLGLATEPYRIDSQCKYAVVGRGDASIYLRLPTRPDYREKIWDHAAGKFVVEQAGGRVTDVRGRPLDFSHGRRLEHNVGVVATDGSFHDDVVAAVRAVIDG